MKLAGQYELTGKEKTALCFAERFATSHESLDEAFMKSVRDHFSDPELIELGFVTGAFLMLGRLNRALDIAPMEDGAHSDLKSVISGT